MTTTNVAQLPAIIQFLSYLPPMNKIIYRICMHTVFYILCAYIHIHIFSGVTLLPQIFTQSFIGKKSTKFKAENQLLNSNIVYDATHTPHFHNWAYTLREHKPPFPCKEHELQAHIPNPGSFKKLSNKTSSTIFWNIVHIYQK